MGGEITRPARERDREKTLAVALQIEEQVGSQGILESNIPQLSLVPFPLDQHTPHAGLVLNEEAEGISQTAVRIAIAKAFSADQIRAILRVCDTFVRGDEWIGVLAIAIWVGGALSVIAHLRAQNLLLDGNHPLLSIPDADQPGGARSLHPMHPLLCDYLRQRSAADDSAAYFFPSLAAREAITPGFLVAEFGDLLVAAGLEQSGFDQHFSAMGASLSGFSSDSLRYPLDQEQAEAIMSSAFSIRFKRFQAKRFEQLFELPRKSPRQQLPDAGPNMISTRVI